MSVIVFLKSHIKGYTRKDGVFVPAHENKVAKKVQPGVAQFDHKAPLPPEAYANAAKPQEVPEKPAKVTGAQFGGKTPGTEPKKKWHNSLIGKMKEKQYSEGEETGHQHAFFFQPKHYPNAKPHPQLDDAGHPIKINEPDTPSAPETWKDPQAVATFTPGSDVPDTLNGVDFAPWQAPENDAGWHFVEGQNHAIDEPVFSPKGKQPAAGVVIEEPDGRVWLMRPTNGFGGYDATFPKGRIEPGMSLQASAIKEAFEETGMKVEITGFIGDIQRTQTTARFYRARRVGGTPAAMGWEAQAVQLVPKDQLYDILNSVVDHDLADMAGYEVPADEEQEDSRKA